MATTGARASREDNNANARSNMQDMNSDIEQLRKDIAQLTDHLKQAGYRSVSRAQRAAKDSAGQLRGTAEDFQDDMAEMVREKPMAALAMAAGVGFLLAMMMRR